MRKLILLLIMLPFAWMVEVEAQTPTPTIDGYFNPIGEFEPGYFESGIGWSSVINGWHENADGTVQVFTNFDTIDDQFIDYSFVLDGENWYPSSARQGTFGILENAFEPGDWFSYGEGGVFNNQGVCVLPIATGTTFTRSYIDTTHNLVILVLNIPYDPLSGLWEDSHNDVIIWDGETSETVASGLSNVTSILPVPDEDAVFLTANEIPGSGFPPLYKISLGEKMLVALDDNETFPFPDGTVWIADSDYFLGKPVMCGSTPGWGGFVSLQTENGWDDVYTPDFSGSLGLTVSPDSTTLFWQGGNSDLDVGGYVSGFAFTEDMVSWTPVVDERGAECLDCSGLVIYSKGFMWVLDKRHNTNHIGIENEPGSYDMYVLKDTYTPYSTSVQEPNQKTVVVYPNPATEEFIYGLPLSANLFALDGTIVKTINENETSVDVRDVPSGIYILTLADGSTSKVVITH